MEEGGEVVDENGTEEGLNSGMGESKSGGGSSSWCLRIVNTFWRCKTTLKFWSRWLAARSELARAEYAAALVTNLKTFCDDGPQAPCASTIIGTNTRLLSAQLLPYLGYFTLFSYRSAAAAVTLLAD